ncbi:hypothetical protein bas59_0089 [Escherichia phage EduardKellenberger]|uniref:Macro domain-containing protein n=2 Tax=Vequintavirus TaxID=1914852 RepID=A0AAE7VVX2_9CAUD|nr:hypothetical protein bas59_0089 [Escherichia phage EduardKellenberger]QXV82612.1 hypothetical protein bas54_0092 [Escherichia phage MaxBurger]HCN3189186.1 macro domain-containing protein [Escherichia coli]
MIIDTVKGDLISIFKKGSGHMIHGCNCFHTMGAGIAKDIAREFPQALAADKETAYGNLDKLGMFSCWEHFAKARVVYGINLYTQFYPGPNAEYFSIMKGFERVNEVFKGMSLPFYIPKIGCGIGGLKWEHVEDVINLATTDIDVVVVEYKKC